MLETAAPAKPTQALATGRSLRALAVTRSKTVPSSRTTPWLGAAADAGNGSTARERNSTVRISAGAQSGGGAPSTSVPSLVTPNTATRSLTSRAAAAFEAACCPGDCPGVDEAASATSQIHTILRKSF